jgi:hypothetical protein
MEMVEAKQYGEATRPGYNFVLAFLQFAYQKRG